MHAYNLDRPETLRTHLARQRMLYEARADGQGGYHWETVTASDPSPFEPSVEPPPFSAKSFSSPSVNRCFASMAGSSIRHCQRWCHR